MKQVEANNAVTVAGMTKPKRLENEILSDLSVSTANKLQSIRVHPLKHFQLSQLEPNRVFTNIMPHLFNFCPIYYHCQDVGKYFKQASKQFEKQVAKETRFYNPLIR